MRYDFAQTPCEDRSVIKLTILIDAEGCRTTTGCVQQGAIIPALPVFSQRPHATGAIIRKDIGADKVRNGETAIDITAGDGISLGVRIFRHRIGIGFGTGRLTDIVVVVGPFPAAPAIIVAPLDNVDFLIGVLTDIARPQALGG